MRFFSSVVLLVLLAWDVPGWAAAQEPPSPAPAEQPKEEPPKDQFFAGYVTALSATQMTVSRTVLGDKSSTRTFQLTPETRIEGKLRVKSRVTVQYVGTDEGDRAIRVIVRSSSQKKQG